MWKNIMHHSVQHGNEGGQLIEKTTEYVLSCIVVSTTMSWKVWTSEENES